MKFEIIEERTLDYNKMLLCRVTTGIWPFKKEREQWFRRDAGDWYNFPEVQCVTREVGVILTSLLHQRAVEAERVNTERQWREDYERLEQQRGNRPLLDLAETEL